MNFNVQYYQLVLSAGGAVADILTGSEESIFD